MSTEVARPALGFVADHPALDFLNSIAAPRGTEFDWLSNGTDLLDWLEARGLVSADELTDMRNRAEPELLEQAAARARQLREWFRGFILKHAGTPLEDIPPSDLAPLNEILMRGSSFFQLEASLGGPPQLTRRNRWGGTDMLLVPIAEAMALLITSVDFTEVKNCEGPTCTMIFTDISKNRKRRWCSMAVCGNRAKASAHRARKGAENT